MFARHLRPLRASAGTRIAERRRLPARRILVTAALVLVAGGALAATRPWARESIAHSPHPPPTISADAQHSDELDALMVLRRKATPADRSASVDKLARYAGSPGSTSGVRTDYIRRVGTSPTGEPIVLVPLKDWAPNPTSTTRKRDAFCLVYPDPSGDELSKRSRMAAPLARSAIASSGSCLMGWPRSRSCSGRIQT